MRETCQHCNRMAPSQPSATPLPITPPSFTFQKACADFFHYKRVNYLVIIEQYSNWPIIERSQDGAKDLIDCLRRTFVTFGIPEELATDDDPEFTAASKQLFLQNWGVHHRKKLKLKFSIFCEFNH